MKVAALVLMIAAVPLCAAAAQDASLNGAAPMASSGKSAVGLADFQARRRARLMRADTDHDGRISLAEWATQRAAHQGHGGAQGDPARMFRRLDANRDGYLTSDEIDAFTARRFSRADVDHDGRITPYESEKLNKGRREPTQPLNPQ